MTLDLLLPALASGALIGFVLGLIGGGGSILAVPLLVFVVGVASPHEAIGTAAVAVAVNALAGLAGHARGGAVKWRCGLVFAGAGIAGALIGAELGKIVDGEKLLFLFGLLMVGVGASMLPARKSIEHPEVRLTRSSAAHLLPRLLTAGLGVGLLAGFFGIGGGFLIVPGLIAATAMPLASAAATSLLAVAAFGATTAGSYAVSGLVDWRLTALLVAGGVVGAAAGTFAAKRLSARKRVLERGFAATVIAVGVYVAARSF